MSAMATVSSASSIRQKPAILGRSAVSGRYVLAPVASKKSDISDTRIAAAVKSVLAKKK